MKTPKIRTKLLFMQTQGFETFIDPMPGVPRADDLIDAQYMINPDDCSSTILERIFSLSWRVLFVNWKTDEKGYYVELTLEGE